MDAINWTQMREEHPSKTKRICDILLEKSISWT